MIAILKKIDAAMAAAQRGILFFLMALLTSAMFAEVITRYFFHTSLFGLEQFIGYASVWVYMLGSSYGTYERSHIKAEFIGILFKNPRIRNAVRCIAALISTAMSAVFAKWSYDFCADSIRMHETTPTHGVPMIYFQLSLLVGAVLMVVYFAWEAIDTGRQAYRG